MRRWQKINRIPWKVVGVLAVLALAAGAWFWPRGLDVRDGRHDRGSNGLVLGTAWVADDGWFTRAQREADKARVRDPIVLGELARTLREHHVTELFLRLPPPDAEGVLNSLDAARLEALLYECYDVRGWAQIVAHDLPLSDARWRRFFLVDLRRLLDRHPRLRGVQFELGGIADGSADFLALLDEARASFAPDGRLISVALEAWRESFTREVARRADYLSTPIARAGQSLAWSEGKPLLIRLLADKHLRGSLRKLHRDLSRASLPANYLGVVLEAEDIPPASLWSDLRERFLRPP